MENYRMKTLYTFLFIAFFCIVKSQNYKQTENLTKQSVAELFKPKNASIVHQIIETDIWEMKNVILVFYESRYLDEDQRERQYIEGNLLIPNQKNQYKKVLISKFEDDNVDTEINSIFFANADKDKEKELIILTKNQHRLQYLYDGTEYSTFVFDNFKKVKTPKEMTLLADISNELFGGFDGFLEDNPNSKAKFKTAEQVKKQLKKLGY